MAFPVDLTSTLTGATQWQLAHWRRASKVLLAPEVSRDPVLYSFRDLVSLRTCVKLRKDVSLQKIRQALDELRQLSLTEHPSQHTLVTDGSSVYWVEADSKAAIDLTRGGQRVLTNLGSVFEPFVNFQGHDVVDFRRPRPMLEVEEHRLGGWPTIRGTRVPYDTVADLVADDSMTSSDVEYFYPGVPAPAVDDAVDFAEQVGYGDGRPA